MNQNKIITLCVFAVLIAACHTAKKSTASSTETSPAPPVVNEQQNSSFPFMLNTADYIAPGNEELAAIQKQYADVTWEELKTGHEIYTKGACVNCHGPQSIGRFNMEQWKILVDDMAECSSLNKEQKNAVYNYVLAIKAKQIKE
jgi:hypothetical protein